MDELINIFVTSNYTEEGAEDIFQALGLCRLFNYLDPFVTIDNLLMTSDDHETTTLVDGVTESILNAQAYILDRHGISLTNETTVAYNNSILKVMYQLQNLESPNPVLTVIESDMSADEKYAEIMEMFTGTPHTTHLQIIDTIRPVFLSNLADFLYCQEQNESKATLDIPFIREQVKLFKDVYGINPAVQTILDVGTVMGEPFKLMLPLYDEFRSIVTDEKVLVEILMFLLLMSSDGVRNPMKVYTEYSDYIIRDLSTSDRLGKTIGEMYNAMQRHKGLNK